MDTNELQTLLNKLKDIRNAANWAGKFTFEIRDATRELRYDKIAHPLDEVIEAFEAELRKRRRKRAKRRPAAPEYRAPYTD
jgi:hypothetical protein